MLRAFQMVRISCALFLLDRIRSILCRYGATKRHSYDFTTSGVLDFFIVWLCRCEYCDWSLSQFMLLYFFRNAVMIFGSVVVLGELELYACLRFPGGCLHKPTVQYMRRQTAPKFAWRAIYYSCVVTTTTTVFMVRNGRRWTVQRQRTARITATWMMSLYSTATSLRSTLCACVVGNVHHKHRDRFICSF